MRTALAVLLFAACAPDSTMYPPGGGPGGGAGGNGGGGGSGGSGATADANLDVIEGIVCVLPDPRDFTTCFGSGVGGIDVAVGAQTAVTNDDGTFTINTPSGTNLVWSISGSDVMSSTIGFSTSAVIPAIQTMTFETLANENGIVFDPTQGTIIGQVLHSGSGFADTTAAAAPIGIYQTLYASPADQADWLDAETTTTFGTFLIAGLTPGTETLTLTPDAGSAATVNDVPSGSGVITFVSAAM